MRSRCGSATRSTAVFVSRSNTNTKTPRANCPRTIGCDATGSKSTIRCGSALLIFLVLLLFVFHFLIYTLILPSVLIYSTVLVFTLLKLLLVTSVVLSCSVIYRSICHGLFVSLSFGVSLCLLIYPQILILYTLRALLMCVYFRVGTVS